MKYNLRNFAITFIISLVVFGAIAWIIVNSLTDMSEDILKGNAVETPPEISEDDNPNNDDQKNQENLDFKGKTFNFLAVGMNTLPNSPNSSSEIEAIMYVRADKENKKFYFLSIPTDFVINYKGENMQLGQLTNHLYINNSDQMSSLLNEITSLTGLKVDYYAFVDMKGFVNILDSFDGISYRVPVDMKYQDPEQNLVIDFKEGQVISSGDDILKMLRYVTYNNIEGPVNTDNAYNQLQLSKDQHARMSLHMSFIKSLFKNILTSNNLFSISMRTDLFNIAKTNFGFEMISDNVDLILSYQTYDSINLTYCNNYVNSVTEKYSDHEPNKSAITQAISKINTEIGKMR